MNYVLGMLNWVSHLGELLSLIGIIKVRLIPIEFHWRNAVQCELIVCTLILNNINKIFFSMTVPRRRNEKRARILKRKRDSASISRSGTFPQVRRLISPHLSFKNKGRRISFRDSFDNRRSIITESANGDKLTLGHRAFQWDPKTGTAEGVKIHLNLHKSEMKVQPTLE